MLYFNWYFIFERYPIFWKQPVRHRGSMSRSSGRWNMSFLAADTGKNRECICWVKNTWWFLFWKKERTHEWWHFRKDAGRKVTESCIWAENGQNCTIRLRRYTSSRGWMKNRRFLTATISTPFAGQVGHTSLTNGVQFKNRLCGFLYFSSCDNWMPTFIPSTKPAFSWSRQRVQTG